MQTTGIQYFASGLLYYKEIEIDASTVVYFKLTVPETDDYTFLTLYINGYKDLYMIILDEEFNIITTSDDDGGNLQPQKTVALYEGETYYILIRQYSSVASESSSFNFQIKQ